MIVTRNNNNFQVKRSKCWHYYIRPIVLGSGNSHFKAYGAWKRCTRGWLEKYFREVE